MSAIAAMLIIPRLGYAGGRRCQIFCFSSPLIKAASRHHPSAGVALVVAVVVKMCPEIANSILRCFIAYIAGLPMPIGVAYPPCEDIVCVVFTAAGAAFSLLNAGRAAVAVASFYDLVSFAGVVLTVDRMGTVAVRVKCEGRMLIGIYVTILAPTDTTPGRISAVSLLERTASRFGVTGVQVTGAVVGHIAVARPAPPIVIVWVDLTINGLAAAALRATYTVGAIQCAGYRLTIAAALALAGAYMGLIVVGRKGPVVIQRISVFKATDGTNSLFRAGRRSAGMGFFK